MTTTEIQARIGNIEAAIATQNFSMNHFVLLAGEWQGLKRSIGQTGDVVNAWAMLWKLRGI